MAPVSDALYLHNYRGAIALSNMGVSLLQQGTFRQAFQTSKDAVFIMKLLFRSRVSINCSQLLNSRVDEKLHRALRRVAIATNNPSRSTGTPELKMLSHDSRLSSIRSTMTTSHGQSFTFAFPIWIDDFDREERDTNLDIAIILHNFSIAHLLIGHQQGKGSVDARKMRGDAFKVVSLAYATLIGVENDLRNHRLLVASAILYSVIQALMEMEKISEASEYREKLEQLMQLEEESELDGSNIMVAPAA